MRKKLLLGGVVVAVVLIAVGAWLFQPWLVWVDEKADEELSGEATVKDPGGLDASDAAEPTDPTDATGATKPALVELASGDFIDAEHGTSGRVQIVRKADGSRLLQIRGLDTSNGPDLHVWITDRPSGGDCKGCSDSWGIYDDGEYVALGALRGNQGDLEYRIPARADLGAMRSVVIWCDRFNVAFGTAAIA